MEQAEQTPEIKSEPYFFSPMVAGYLAMTAVLFIWSGFSLTVRAINGSSLTMADVALIRFAIPVLLLLPMLPSRLKKIKRIRLSDLFLVMLGGLPFFFFAALGAKTAPTAYMGSILAGTPPFFVAILTCCCYRQVISKKQLFTLTLIMSGVMVMILGQSEEISADILRGVAFLFCGSFVWAGFTLGIRRAGIDAISITIILSISSFFIILALMASGLMTSNFGSFSLSEALPFILVQGLGAGFIAIIGYSYAVHHLGPAKSSVIGSLSPGVTALLAVPVFNEPLSMAILIGISLTTLGVILSNRS
ncbi:DMT family transporter [Psychromonas sp.]|uniref:DMT family transporter n=1 Tax=Psychromonas sp. TaxID=1884585 RepID=UPI0035637773